MMSRLSPAVAFFVTTAFLDWKARPAEPNNDVVTIHYATFWPRLGPDVTGQPPLDELC